MDNANNAFDAALLKDTAAAVASWSNTIYGRGTIDIQVTVAGTTSIGTANGGPATSVYVGKDGSTAIYRGGAESELLTGKDPNGASPDILITIDPDFIKTYLYLDPDPAHPSAIPANRSDGIGVLVHEIGHGLGISGFRNADTGVLPSYESPWDRLVQLNADGSANFTGANAVSVFGGRVNVTTEHNAEQYFHFGSSASDAIASDVMAGYGLSPGHLHRVSNVDLGVMKDLGLNVYGSAGGNPLIDALYYAKSYQDVAKAHVDIATHYNSNGWHEGRNPNALFSTVGYLAANRDVNKAAVNPLSHYDSNGWKEGRDPSAGFDDELYLARNPDVKAAGIDPLGHYLSVGIFEGRQAYAAIGRSSDVAASHGFDAEYYLLANTDVAKAALSAGGDSFRFAFQHYDTYGWHEGRDPNAVFDTKAYLAAYADVKAAQIDPLMHYDTYGWHEDRNPSATFNTHAYEAANHDVAAAHVDPMLHYLTSGALEGRPLA